MDLSGSLISGTTLAPPYQEIPSQQSIGGSGYPSFYVTWLDYYNGSYPNCKFAAKSRIGEWIAPVPGPISVTSSGTDAYLNHGNGSNLLARARSAFGCYGRITAATLTSIRWVTPPIRTEYRLACVDANQQTFLDSDWRLSPPSIVREICGCKVDLELECGNFPHDFCCLDCQEVSNKADQILGRLP